MAHPQSSPRGYKASGAAVFSGKSGETNTLLQTKHGVVKFHRRPATTTNAYVVEVKSEPTSVSGSFFNVESTLDAKPSTATSALGSNALGGICRLYTGYTMTGGGLCGVYGQIQNNGTINGATSINAAVYSLIEDGGTWTAVSHLASLWVDSHMDQTITAGNYEMVYISNNGNTTPTNVFYIYGGATQLFELETVGNMVSANNAGGSTIDFTNWRTIKIKLGGVNGAGADTYYLIAAKTIADTAG